MSTETDSGEECWSCESEIAQDHNYCSQCAVPVKEFNVRAGKGFLSDESRRYLQAIAENSVEYPTDSRIAPELESSLQAQLREDVRKALIQLGTACVVDEAILMKSIELGNLRAGMDPEDIEEADIPASFSGFFNVAMGVANLLGPSGLEALAERQTE